MATIIKSENKELTEKVIETLKTVFDPEIPVNIYELGLIYEIEIDKENNTNVIMTLTAPTCPVAEDLVQDVVDKIKVLIGTKEVHVELTFDPPWDMGMMSLEAKLELGFM